MKTKTKVGNPVKDYVDAYNELEKGVKKIIKKEKVEARKSRNNHEVVLARGWALVYKNSGNIIPSLDFNLDLIIRKTKPKSITYNDTVCKVVRVKVVEVKE